MLFSGCSMSVPMLGSQDAPEVTGSIAAPVDVQQPLPQTLAYSDATMIGRAAANALWQVDRSENGDWVNAATGSSGTLEDGGATEDGGGGDEDSRLSGACRLFNTMVTSFGGVHRYTGRICRSDDGRSVVEIGSPDEAQRS